MTKSKIEKVEIESFDFLENRENILRPKNFSSYIGQKNIKENLSVFIKAAKARKENLDHILLYGPAGLGKTTLANLLAREMESNIKIISAPMLEKNGELAAILTNLQENDILFIDEIHRLNASVEEILYSAMEDFKLDIIIGSGVSAQTVKIDLARFTLIGATTKAGSLSSPLRDRFGLQFKLEFYSDEDLALIIQQASKKLDLEASAEASLELAKRSRATPRIALKLLKQVRDFAQVNKEEKISKARVLSALASLGIDEFGFTASDRKYLSALFSAKKALGLSTLANLLAEDESSIEDMIEPYLLGNSFIEKTSKGRLVSQKALALKDKILKKENI